MSFSSAEARERKLSINNKNAYLTVFADEIKKTKSDETLNSTNKTNTRTRSCSPALLLVNNENKLKEDSAATAVDMKKSVSNTVNVNNMPAVTVSTPKPVQVGIDRYITVLKRGRSPNSSKVASMPKLLKDKEAPRLNSNNRFSALDNRTEEEFPVVAKPSRPPPIYLREKNSNDLIKRIVSLIGQNSFYVVPIKRGKIDETKIHVHSENDFRKMVEEFEKQNKNFYTYQLKSSKGLQVVIKGIDSCVDPDDIKASLKNDGFKVKNVSNIKNRERVPQPMFRVELEPNDIKLKKNETHPIYNLKFLLHRKITVEEPHKRSGPVQCLNCQEFGHTRAYCKLPPVCVICGELHFSSECDKPKDKASIKKCSNCGGNHTANYRGCPVYNFIRQSSIKKSGKPNSQQINLIENKYPQIPQPMTNKTSYANILRNNQPSTQNSQPINTPSSNLNSESKNKNTGHDFSRLEATIETLVQTVNNFTNSMSNMMQEMLKMQSLLLQAVLNKP